MKVSYHYLIKPMLFLAVLSFMFTGCSADPIITESQNGMKNYNGYLYNEPKELDERSVTRFAEKVNSIFDIYLNDEMNIYYSVIPDKSIYIEDTRLDSYYLPMIKILNQEISNAEYIELYDTLSLEKYYKTDDHWRQECLEEAVNKIGVVMGFETDFNDYIKNEYEYFTGMYYDKIDSLENETLYYLTNEITDIAEVDNYQKPEFTSIYDTECLESDNKYDVFLSGASPLITINNSESDSDRELIIFRDSFASSLTPLLIENYKTITLIDIRYIVTSLIGDYVEFTNQDVMFLYCDMVVNNSTMLK